MFKKYQNLWLALGVLIILSPLGLIATGTAFGEWGPDELIDEVGFLPAGLAKFVDLWKHAFFPDYAISGFDASVAQSVIGYIFSALIGVVLVVGLIALLGKLARD